MTNVAVIFIGTNKYLDFLPKYYDSCEEHFMPDANKQYFVFTDGNLEGNIPVSYTHLTLPTNREV